MTDLKPGNDLFLWTTTFFRQLQSRGVKHLVISPGSRSTPLTLAAAANPHFQKHVILDERSAGFTALGIGKATNVPAVLICTSGTALANYYPAVIEARQSGVPIILATADRPPQLRNTGANQAIDQLKIFGDYPVFFHDVGEPASEQADLDRLKLLADQAYQLSREKRGPVHLNFPFRKPLEPDPDFLEKISAENEELPDEQFPGKQIERESFVFSEELTNTLNESEKPLIILGPTAPGDNIQSIANLAERISCPILSEATIQSPNAISGFAGFLRNENRLKNLEPDLILRFGFQPTAKSLELALKNWQPEHHLHFSSTGDWQDATFSGAERIAWYGRELYPGDELVLHTKDWLEQWQTVQRKFQNYVEQIFSDAPEFSDGHIYHHLTPQLRSDHFVMVSNSFPARDIQMFGRQDASVPLFLNRGASGIDGITSTTLGISLVQSKPGVLFTGDLAFLHDSNALLNHRLTDQPLTIIVINNKGGSIFRMLPVEQHEKYFKPYFETPQSASIKQLAKAHEVPYHRIGSLNALWDFNLANWQKEQDGVSVIECVTDADASMALRKKLWSY